MLPTQVETLVHKQKWVQPSTQTVAVLRNSDLHSGTTVLKIVVYNVGGTLKKYEHFIEVTNFNLTFAKMECAVSENI
jgi:hypothetical protein